MSTLYTQIKDEFEKICLLFAKKSDLKNIAYTGKYEDLINAPKDKFVFTTESGSQVGGTVAFRFNGSQTATTTLNESEAGTLALSGSLNVNNKVNVATSVTSPVFYGKIVSNGADLAEKYISDNPNYEPGTLIVFDGDSNSNYEFTVATSKCNGVISKAPGVLLNYAGKGMPIALAGRTPVLVEGTIKKFDKIVLSETPGIARAKMNINEKVIGISLENKNKEDIATIECIVHFTLD